MRHKRAGYKLQRDPAARRALLRGLVTSVIENEPERVITTVKIDDHSGRSDRMRGKVESVERELGRELSKD